MNKPVLASVCWYGLEHIDSGGKARAFNLLRYMQEFIPWIIAPSTDKSSSLNAMTIKGRPLKIKRFFNGEIFNYLWPDKIWQVIKALKDINPNTVQAEGIWSFPAVYFYCRKFRRIFIIGANNIEYKVAEEMYGKGFRSAFLKIIERYCYRRADLLVVCSEEDKAKVVDDFSVAEQKVIVVPNGVDDKRFNVDKKIESKISCVLFMGKLDYGPNREALSFITKKLMPRLKNIKCMIIGSGINKKDCDKNVEYLGRVDDVRKYITRADICLAPIWSGSGTRLKVLEYLAAARPLVATAKAVEGLGLEKGRHYLEAEDITQFENAIKEILNHQEKWNKNAREARTFVLSQYNWQKIVSGYEGKLGKVLSDSGF